MSSKTKKHAWKAPAEGDESSHTSNTGMATMSSTERENLRIFALCLAASSTSESQCSSGGRATG